MKMVDANSVSGTLDIFNLTCNEHSLVVLMRNSTWSRDYNMTQGRYLSVKVVPFAHALRANYMNSEYNYIYHILHSVLLVQLAFYFSKMDLNVMMIETNARTIIDKIVITRETSSMK